LLVLGTPFEALGLHMASYEMGYGLEWILNRYTVRYVPGARLLRNCEQRVAQRTAAEPLLFAVLDPHGDLPASRAEAGILDDRFARRRYVHGGDAVIERIRADILGASHLHFSGHGRYAPEDPLQSGLLLATGDGMTAGEVLTTFDLSCSRLVTLATCESGITDSEALAAEYLGLPTAFLAAGAPAVLSALWRVDDEAALLIMDRFYTAHRGSGLSAARALAGAQRWVREATNGQVSAAFIDIKSRAHPAWSETAAVAQSASEFYDAQPAGDRPFEQPYYWAPFVLMGADVPGEVTAA
jgi:CHAT domain-containing protein